MNIAASLPIFPAATASDPCPVDQREWDLTEKWITPDLDRIIEGLTKIRAKIDEQFEKEKAVTLEGEQAVHLAGLKDIRQYPYGYCDVIRDMVWNAIGDNMRHPNKESRYFSSVQSFLQEGGHARKIWGELTYGPYFQNAIQIGAYYIDAANDTVDVTKPKLDVKYLKDASMRSVDDYEQYFDITDSYYDWDVFPNTFFPELAVLFPGVARYRKTGALMLCDIAEPLVLKNLNAVGDLAGRFFAAPSYKMKSPSPADLDKIEAFRTTVWPKMLADGIARHPVIEADLAAVSSAGALGEWLRKQQPRQEYRRAVRRLDSFRKHVSLELRKYSLAYSGA